MALKGWINVEESAKEMLARVLTERPFLLLPPLHRVPLRVGNVVEIVGPSPSAKTQILIQAAISCVLPKEWKGVHYGGSERLVMYFDLDCRFDIERLSQSLKHRIIEANGSRSKTSWESIGYEQKHDTAMTSSDFDEELFIACMKRFLYVRCYNSFEFLATLKTLCYQLQKEREAHGVGVQFLMIDRLAPLKLFSTALIKQFVRLESERYTLIFPSINAFYWVDRASTPLPLGGDNRKSLSLHGMVEAIVQELQKLLLVQPMLLLATKATILGDGSLMSDLKRNLGKWPLQDTSDIRTSRGPQKNSYREYMPSVWQLFITHRILVQVSDEDFDDSKHQNQSTYTAEWLLPSLSFFDRFRVNDAGIYMVS